MKITKPKENQLLFEDDVFKDFKLECEHKNIIEGSKFDDNYNGIVLGYRFTPMGSSKQMFYGNNISILTLLYGRRYNGKCLKNRKQAKGAL